MWKIAKHLMIAAAVAVLAPSLFAEAKPGREGGEPLVIPTFHCLGVYWSPEGGGKGEQVLVKYRKSGQEEWREGLSLEYNPVDAPECKADYRGSLVNLTPGTAYEIELRLGKTGKKAACRGTTWSEEFPVEEVVKVASRDAMLSVEKSGTPDGYVLYDGTGCTIDTDNSEGLGIGVDASYVILRGFTIRNVKEHGIRIFGGHHIVIEDCDISKWGSESEQGWGKDSQAAVFSNDKELHNVVIQRCLMHHPSWDTNSWAEKHGKSTHPSGPQTVVFRDSAGNHVIRYNEIWSDKDHYFNDGIGSGANGSYRGFPGPDSDIYGNYIANCWDDGIEAEGCGQNVRIWNNYVEETLIPIANAAVSIGPYYVWRNVSGRSYSPSGSEWDMASGPFMKMGFAGGEQWMTGHMYVFNNTIFQKADEGAGGLGGDSRIIKHCTSRNNILHVRKGERRSVSISRSHAGNDFDHDLLSAGFPEGQEAHGVKGTPEYVPGAGFDAETKTGVFQLAPGSKGMNAAEIIPNFCEVVGNDLPDIGAHESGTGEMRFGVKARFIPPGANR